MYSIIFEDLTEFIGGSPEDSKWLNMPNKNIKQLKYSFMGKTITLTDYQSYNHVVVHAILPQGNRQIIAKVILMVRKDNDVLNIILNFIKGKIEYEPTTWGKEYRGKPHLFWKVGIIGLKPQASIK